MEILKLVVCDPAEVLDVNGFGLARNQATIEEAEADGFFGISMGEVFDEFADGDLDVEFFADFANEASFECFAGLDFAAGEFPEVGKVIVGTALGDEEFAVVKD